MDFGVLSACSACCPPIAPDAMLEFSSNAFSFKCVYDQAFMGTLTFKVACKSCWCKYLRIKLMLFRLIKLHALCGNPVSSTLTNCPTTLLEWRGSSMCCHAMFPIPLCGPCARTMTASGHLERGLPGPAKCRKQGDVKVGQYGYSTCPLIVGCCSCSQILLLWSDTSLVVGYSSCSQMLLL